MSDTELLDRLTALKIRLSSPDRSVCATYTARDGIGVEPGPDGLGDRDRTTVQKSIESAVIELLRQRPRIMRELSGSKAPDPETRLAALPPEERQNRLTWQQKATEAMRPFEADLSSADGACRVQVNGSGEPTVTIRPGELHRSATADRRLFEELTTVLRQAYEQLNLRAHEVIAAVHEARRDK